VDAFDVAPPEMRSPISWDAYAMLPSRENTSQAIDVVLSTACCTLQFLDADTLHEITEKAYQALDSGSLGPCRKELSLLFAVLALARRFDTNWQVSTNDNDAGIANGYVSMIRKPP
jgi:hypothetical protein